MLQNYTYITNTMFGYCLSDSKITFNFVANIVFAYEYYLCGENLNSK